MINRICNKPWTNFGTKRRCMKRRHFFLTLLCVVPVLSRQCSVQPMSSPEEEEGRKRWEVHVGRMTTMTTVYLNQTDQTDRDRPTGLLRQRKWSYCLSTLWIYLALYVIMIYDIWYSICLYQQRHGQILLTVECGAYSYRTLLIFI